MECSTLVPSCFPHAHRSAYTLTDTLPDGRDHVPRRSRTAIRSGHQFENDLLGPFPHNEPAQGREALSSTIVEKWFTASGPILLAKDTLPYARMISSSMKPPGYKRMSPFYGRLVWFSRGTSILRSRAGRLRVFLGITLPLLKSTVLYVLVTKFVSVFHVLTPNYILTQGGPGTASTTIVIEIVTGGFLRYPGRMKPGFLHKPPVPLPRLV